MKRLILSIFLSLVVIVAGVYFLFRVDDPSNLSPQVNMQKQENGPQKKYTFYIKIPRELDAFISEESGEFVVSLIDDYSPARDRFPAKMISRAPGMISVAASAPTTRSSDLKFARVSWRSKDMYFLTQMAEIAAASAPDSPNGLYAFRRGLFAPPEGACPRGLESPDFMELQITPTAESKKMLVPSRKYGVFAHLFETNKEGRNQGGLMLAQAHVSGAALLNEQETIKIPMSPFFASVLNSERVFARLELGLMPCKAGDAEADCTSTSTSYSFFSKNKLVLVPKSNSSPRRTCEGDIHKFLLVPALHNFMDTVETERAKPN